MTVASGSRHALAIVPEGVFATTPATPAFKLVRYNTTSLELDKAALQSAEIRSDRQIAGFRHGTRSVAGDIVAELSFGSHDDLLAAALMGAWTGDVLKAGLLRPSFTVERNFADITQYLRFIGCEVNTFALTCSPGAIITTTYGMSGIDAAPMGATPVVGSTYTPATTTEPMTGLEGGVAESGSALAVVSQIQLALNNGVSPNYVIGSPISIQPSVGKSNMTGTLTAFLQDASLYNKFRNETAGSIEFSATDVIGNQYDFLLPNVKFNGGPIPVQNDGPITIQIPFQALYDATTGTNIQVTRTAFTP